MEVEFLNYAYGAAAMVFTESLVFIPFLVARRLRDCKHELVRLG